MQRDKNARVAYGAGGLLFILFATACLMLVGPVAADPPNPRPMTQARYGELLGDAERQFILGQDNQLDGTIRLLSNADVFETPTYGYKVFVAYSAFRNGNRDVALAELAEFRNMLRIDSGLATCSDVDDEILFNCRAARSPEAYRVMCGEMFLAYYEHPTRETLLQVARYWSIADQVETRMRVSR